MTPRALAPLALCLFMSACAAGENYVAPDMNSAPQFRNQTGAQTGVALPQDWWTGFHDPTLNALEQKALAQNLDIAAAAARVMQARAASRAAGAALLPAVELDPKAAQAEQSKLGSNGAIVSYFPHYPRSGALYDFNAGAAWELDLFGGLRRQSEAARAERKAADAGLAGARLMVSCDLADAYIQYRALQLRLKLAERAKEIDGHFLELVELRFQAGQAARRERDGAEAALDQAAALIPQLKLGLEGQRNRIAVLTGTSPEAEQGALEAQGPIPEPLATPTGSPADLLRHRPDLIAAERQLAAADARIGAAISDYYPKITLQGLTGFESTQTSNLFTGPAQQTQGLAGIRWRLFDFGRIDAEVAAARGKKAEALAAYRGAVLRAAEDVEDALAQAQQKASQHGELRKAVHALSAARQSAEDAYTAGAVSLLEVVDAERQLLQSEDQAAEVRGEQSRAAVVLVRALGG